MPRVTTSTITFRRTFATCLCVGNKNFTNSARWTRDQIFLSSTVSQARHSTVPLRLVGLQISSVGELGELALPRHDFQVSRSFFSHLKAKSCMRYKVSWEASQDECGSGKARAVVRTNYYCTGRTRTCQILTVYPYSHEEGCELVLMPDL